MAAFQFSMFRSTLPRRSFIALGLTGIALVALVILGVSHYGGNVSGLLHLDAPFAKQHSIPSGVVVYQDAAYDGMLYYQIARDIPALFSGHQTSLDSPYRFQRILLSLFAFVLTFGHERAFPFVLLLINLGAALGVLALSFSITKKVSLHTMTAVANPAILVGILYSLTEPLSFFFIMFFFWLWERNKRSINFLSLIALLLSLLARETTVFLIAPLFCWMCWQRKWRDALLLAVPIAVFALWQWYLVVHLGSLPFRTNAGNILAIPFSGPILVLQWAFRDSGIQFAYRCSSLFLLFFLLCLCLVLARGWIRKRQKIDVYFFLLSILSMTMLSMHPHMWGAITSIGRVVTPFFPVYVLYASARDTWIEKSLSLLLIALSVITAVGIATVHHPYLVS